MEKRHQRSRENFMKIGLLLPSVGGTQMAFRFISEINDVCRTRQDVDPVIFYENMTIPCAAIGCVITNIADAWSYPGSLITTTLTTTHKSIKFPGPSSKYFYVVDLEWMKIPHKRYESIAEIYQHPDINILARSHEHARIIEEAWARPIRGVVEDFSLKGFIDIIQEDENENKRILRTRV